MLLGWAFLIFPSLGKKTQTKTACSVLFSLTFRLFFSPTKSSVDKLCTEYCCPWLPLPVHIRVSREGLKLQFPSNSPVPSASSVQKEESSSRHLLSPVFLSPTSTHHVEFPDHVYAWRALRHLQQWWHCPGTSSASWHP